MASTIAVTLRARLQTLDITDYLNARSPAAASRFTEWLSKAYRQLSEFPLSGGRSVAGTRRLIVIPYVLTYRVAGDTVEVLDIRHGRQRPPTMPEEEV